MVRFVPNPDFRIEDVIEGAEIKFTCPKCRKKFKKTAVRSEDNRVGIVGPVCPRCGTALKSEAGPDESA